MLYIIELLETNSELRVTKFETVVGVNKYIKNNPLMHEDNFVVLEGELKKYTGHIYDGRFK